MSNRPETLLDTKITELMKKVNDGANQLADKIKLSLLRLPNSPVSSLFLASSSSLLITTAILCYYVHCTLRGAHSCGESPNNIDD